jgi:hypothetical protein
MNLKNPRKRDPKKKKKEKRTTHQILAAINSTSLKKKLNFFLKHSPAVKTNNALFRPCKEL